MKNFLIALFIAASLLNIPVSAQVVKSVEEDITHFVYTGKDIYNGFTSFDQSTQIKLAATMLTIAGGYALDYNVKDFASHTHSNFADNAFSIDKVYGNGYTLIGMAGLYGYGVFFHNQEVRKIGLQTIEAVGYAGIITTVLKSVVGRSRPYTNAGHSKFTPFNIHAATTSFPSGHSTVAFAVSTVLANNTDNIFLKILSYSAAVMVGYSRLYHNAHWFSDVIAGGAIGHFVGDFVSRDNSAAQSAGTTISFQYTPYSLSLTVRF